MWIFALMCVMLLPNADMNRGGAETSKTFCSEAESHLHNSAMSSASTRGTSGFEIRPLFALNASTDSAPHRAPFARNRTAVNARRVLRGEAEASVARMTSIALTLQKTLHGTSMLSRWAQPHSPVEDVAAAVEPPQPCGGFRFSFRGKSNGKEPNGSEFTSGGFNTNPQEYTASVHPQVVDLRIVHHGENSTTKKQFDHALGFMDTIHAEMLVEAYNSMPSAAQPGRLVYTKSISDDPDLPPACFVRLPPEIPPEEKKSLPDALGAVFIDVAKPGKRPWGNDKNVAKVHVVGPKFLVDEDDRNEFQRVLAILGKNILVATSMYNARAAQDTKLKSSPIETVQMGLVGDSDTRHNGKMKPMIAESLLEGFLAGAVELSGFDQRAVPQVSFAYDEDAFLKAMQLRLDEDELDHEETYTLMACGSA